MCDEKEIFCIKMIDREEDPCSIDLAIYRYEIKHFDYICACAKAAREHPDKKLWNECVVEHKEGIKRGN